MLKEEAILTSKSSTEYEKQSVRLNRLRKEYKGLVLEEGKTTAQTKKLLKEITQLDSRLKAVDKSVGQSQREVGNYGKSIDKLKSTLGQLGLAFGAFTLVRNVFKINKEFEESLASLSAITGVVGKDFEEFKVNVQDVATETKKSATEVAQAFEIVGSAKPELLANADALAEVTKQAIILSQATKLDLETTSRSLTGTLNQFNLAAEEAGRVTNALAAGSQAGAAPVNLITESLDKFGTVANSINVSVEQSIGLIETLAEKNITGAEAGTKLRNVLTLIATAETLPKEASKALRKYGVDTALVADTSVDLSVRLKELSKIQGDVNALNAVFGKQNLVVGQTLLQNVDSVQDYTSAVTGTNTAVEQAAINQDTLSAIIDKLKAAWEAVVIKFTEGTGSLNLLKAVLSFVAENLEALLKTIATATVAFGGYKAAVKAAEVANSLFGKSVIKNTKNAGLLGAALGIVAIAAFEVFDKLTRATKAEAALSRASEETAKRLDEEKVQMSLLGKAINDTTAGSKERQKVIDEINAKYGTTLKNLKDEAAFLKQIEGAYKDIVKQLELKIGIQVVTDELIEAEKEFRGIKRRIESGEGTIDDFLQAEEAEQAVKALRNELALLENRPIGSNQIQTREGSGLIDDRFGVDEFENAEKTKTSILKSQTKERADFSSEEEQRQFEERQQREKDRLEQEKENEKIRLDNAKKTQDEINKINKQQEDDDKKRLDQEKKLAEARKKQQEENAKRVLESIKEAAQLIEQEIDKQIESQQARIEGSKSEIDRLQALQEAGDPNAAKALVAEEKAQAREQLKLEKLEKKKRNLQIVVTGLERASQLIGSGVSDPFGQSQGEINGFLSSLPAFFEGTETTVADALGKPHLNTKKDSYLARLDGKEGVLTGDKMDSLRAAGLRTTDEITRAAIMSQNQPTFRPIETRKTRAIDRAMLGEMKKQTKAIENIVIPETDFDMVNLVKTIKKGNKVVREKINDSNITIF